jgi:hypothetical protein
MNFGETFRVQDPCFFLHRHSHRRAGMTGCPLFYELVRQPMSAHANARASMIGGLPGRLPVM